MQGGEWSRERWWYKLVHVCQRWRYLMLGSASYLGLCLVCTYSTPVAEILELAPPLPLIIDLLDPDRDATSKDEDGIILALKHRDRVCRIGLRDCMWLVSTVTKALQGEFPILEHLVLMTPPLQPKGLTFPKAFQAPRLRHLILANYIFPRQSPLLLRTAVGLITLNLDSIHPSTCTSPNYILRRLSQMPRLQTLKLDVEEQLLNKPITTHVTLPNLRRFEFSGESAYLEALLPHFTAPRLKELDINFCERDLPIFSVPQLVQVVNTTKNLKGSGRADLFVLDDGVVWSLCRSANSNTRVYSFCLSVNYPFPDLPLTSLAQISNVLGPIFSHVKLLHLVTVDGLLPSKWHNEDDHLNWRDVLRPFSHANFLFLHRDLVGTISRSLRFDNEESPQAAELLPELRELGCVGSDETVNAFAPFINARKNAGRPVNLTVLPISDFPP